MSSVKEFVRSIPIVGDVVRSLYRSIYSSSSLTNDKTERMPFMGSQSYWEERYVKGGDSGVGSYGKFAEFKADVINSFIDENKINTVVEFGCGDGNQLTLAKYAQYLGFDVSAAAIALCRKRFQLDNTKQFQLLDAYNGETAELAISLDVIYHLLEDKVFEDYLRRLFGAATRFVIIYSSNSDENKYYEGSHVRHRKFTNWVKLNLVGWSLNKQIPNRYPYKGDYTKGSFADFYIYGKVVT